MCTIIEYLHLELQNMGHELGTELFKKAIACVNVNTKGSYIEVDHVVGTYKLSKLTDL